MSETEQALQGAGEKVRRGVGFADGDPFADVKDVSPELKYILKSWDLADAPEDANLVIEGRITEITTSWTIKQGDWLNARVTYQPDLKCDLLVYHPRAAIIAERGDLGIVAEIFRQFGNMTGREAQKIMVTHLDKEYPEPPEEKPRVGAGERRSTDSNQQSEDYA